MLETFSSKIIFLIIEVSPTIENLIQVVISFCVFTSGPVGANNTNPSNVYNLFLGTKLAVKNNQNQKNRKGLNIHVLSFLICISKPAKIQNRIIISGQALVEKQNYSSIDIATQSGGDGRAIKFKTEIKIEIPNSGVWKWSRQ